MKQIPIYGWIILGILVLVALLFYWQYRQQQTLKVQAERKRIEQIQTITAYDVIARMLNNMKEKEIQKP